MFLHIPAHKNVTHPAAQFDASRCMVFRAHHVQMSIYGQWATLSAHATKAEAEEALGDVAARRQTAVLRVYQDA